MVVIGVHTPEFSFEHEPMNVENAVRNLKVTYPVAIDSNYRIWQSFNNQAWPAQYLVDAKGQIRYHHFGEGDYGDIERVIQELLKENGATGLVSEHDRAYPALESRPLLTGRMRDLPKPISDIARHRISPRPKECIKIHPRYSARPRNSR